MKVIRASSSLSKDEIIEKSKKSGVLALSPKLASSVEQFELACILAKKSFKSKNNLARIFELEFLLWLFGERDIRKALGKNDFSPQNFILVSFKKLNKKSLLYELCAKEKPLLLKKTAGDLELEKIALGRL